jgi:hypothetical protein
VIAPEELWARCGALSAAMAAVGNEHVLIDVVDGELGYDDGGGNWARLALIEGGRAVLFGLDHEYSATVGRSPPLDLLAGAPAWVPWETLAPLAADEAVGFVYWHNGAGWARTMYPEDVDDGLPSVGLPLGTDAVANVVEAVRGGAGLEPAAERLLDAARAGTIGSAELAALSEERFYEDEGLAAARRAGLAPGTRPPRLPPGGAPATRRRRRRSDDELAAELARALRGAAELPGRPRPQPGPELEALAAWARARAPAGDGRCSVLVSVRDDGASALPGEHPPARRRDEPPGALMDELAALASALREADAAIAPEAGRWLFLRVETWAVGMDVRRAYDHRPDWWPGPAGPGPGSLRIELARRAPEWRPGWEALLDPARAYEEVSCARPGPGSSPTGRR